MSRAPGGALPCPPGDAGVSALRRHGDHLTQSVWSSQSLGAWALGPGRPANMGASLGPLPSGPKDRPASLGKTKAFSHFPEGSHPAAPA